MRLSVLIIGIEPTPYVLDLFDLLNEKWNGEIDVLFLKENFTQNWNLTLKKNAIVLKSGFFHFLKKIYQIYFQKNYQLFFLAGWSHPMTISCILLSKLCGIPVVVDTDTPHNPKTISWKRCIKRLIYPILFKLPTVFLASGTRQINYLKSYAVPDKKIILEKMTVDVLGMQRYIAQLPKNKKTVLRNNIGLSNNDFIFLFIGRLIERKGVYELLQSFSAIKDVRAKLVIAGDGPLKSAVEEYAQKNKNIVYVGRLKNTEVTDLYFMSDIFILPAHWEPFGLVINEALAAGKPVIASNQVGCIDDLVIHQKTGLRIKENSVFDLTSAMMYFLNHPEQYEMMSQHSLNQISTWTLEDEVAQIFKAWRLAMGCQENVTDVSSENG